jgi:hypothetical protein
VRRRSASANALTAGPRRRSFSCPTAYASTLPPASVGAGRRAGAGGRNCLRPTGQSTPNWPQRLTKCSGTSCQSAGTATCRFSRLVRKASRDDVKLRSRRLPVVGRSSSFTSWTPKSRTRTLRG